MRVSAGAETVNMFGRLEKVYESTKRNQRTGGVSVTSAIKLFRDGGSSSALAVPRRSDYPYDGPVYQKNFVAWSTGMLQESSPLV